MVSRAREGGNIPFTQFGALARLKNSADTRQINRRKAYTSDRIFARTQASLQENEQLQKCSEKDTFMPFSQKKQYICVELIRQRGLGCGSGIVTKQQCLCLTWEQVGHRGSFWHLRLLRLL